MNYTKPLDRHQLKITGMTVECNGLNHLDYTKVPNLGIVHEKDTRRHRLYKWSIALYVWQFPEQYITHASDQISSSALFTR
jgi:hypothetical protein